MHTTTNSCLSIGHFYNILEQHKEGIGDALNILFSNIITWFFILFYLFYFILIFIFIIIFFALLRYFFLEFVVLIEEGVLQEILENGNTLGELYQHYTSLLRNTDTYGYHHRVYLSHLFT